MDADQFNAAMAALGGVLGGAVNDAVAAAVAAALPAGVGGGLGERKLPAFETGVAEDWIQWRMTFNNIADLKGWDEDRRCAMIKASMSGYAILAVSAVQYGPWAAVPAVVAAPGVAAQAAIPARLALTSEEILDAYEARFVTAANSSFARRTFRQAVQGDDETLVAWYTRLIMLYRRTAPNADLETTQELLEAWQEGLISPTIQEHLMDHIPKTMSEALQLATQKAATITMLTAGARARKKASGSIFALQRESTASVSAFGRNCFNCDAPGHFAKECPHPARQQQVRPKQGGGGGGGGGQTDRRANNRRYEKAPPRSASQPPPAATATGGGRPPFKAKAQNPRADTLQQMHAIIADMAQEEQVVATPAPTKASGN